MNFISQLRSRLLALHPQNFHSLRTIESSLISVCLDDARPQDESDVGTGELTSDSLTQVAIW